MDRKDRKVNIIFKWLLGTIGIFAGLFILILIIGLIGATSDGAFDDSNSASDPSILTKEKFGENYPYTIDNLKLKCENNAVWVEDSTGNKYAVNGLAFSNLSNDPKFKGYTTEISKTAPLVEDSKILDLGFTLCKQRR